MHIGSCWLLSTQEFRQVKGHTGLQTNKQKEKEEGEGEEGDEVEGEEEEEEEKRTTTTTELKPTLGNNFSKMLVALQGKMLVAVYFL